MANKEEASEPLKYQTWVFKVPIHCEGCKRKVKKILHSIDGVYTTAIDSQLQKVTVTGNVDADTLMKKLNKSGKHAELWPEPPKKNPDNNNNKKKDKKPSKDAAADEKGGGDSPPAKSGDSDKKPAAAAENPTNNGGGGGGSAPSKSAEPAAPSKEKQQQQKPKAAAAEGKSPATLQKAR
ncbi:hypothetical protein QJS10_CPA05g00452 [Acorus calamus]|uniref:HMA domain-containing protein n=1 Tax=Acorus calamus TaxID=4465 RepID=A0AAV9ET54_ACOCL|nr:hypothetical protein QJS10_CPA05g00452 [Acorus calamus]